MGFLQGKRLLITGVLSNRSIAYGIAAACHREGTELAFTYVGERFKDRVSKFAAEFGSTMVYEMDVTKDEDIAACVESIRNEWGYLDGFVHSIGFAPRECSSGNVLDGLSREAFQVAMDISAYSFPAMAKAFAPLMQGRKATMLTLAVSLHNLPEGMAVGVAAAGWLLGDGAISFAALLSLSIGIAL